MYITRKNWKNVFWKRPLKIFKIFRSTPSIFYTPICPKIQRAILNIWIILRHFFCSSYHIMWLIGKYFRNFKFQKINFFRQKLWPKSKAENSGRVWWHSFARRDPRARRTDSGNGNNGCWRWTIPTWWRWVKGFLECIFIDFPQLFSLQKKLHFL